MTGKEFAKWMDDAGMDLSTAAQHFGVSEQTIYNWRSTRGVADSKEQWVLGRMRDFLGARHLDSVPDRVTLEVSPAVFDDWNRAAMREGKILRDWAIDVLNEEAEADDSTGSSEAFNPLYHLPQEPNLKAAEPEND